MSGFEGRKRNRPNKMSYIGITKQMIIVGMKHSLFYKRSGAILSFKLWMDMKDAQQRRGKGVYAPPFPIPLPRSWFCSMSPS